MCYLRRVIAWILTPFPIKEHCRQKVQVQHVAYAGGQSEYVP